MNQATTIYQQCGLPAAHFGNHGNTRNANATKAGPGRRHVDGDGSRTTAQKRAGAYGRGLRNWIKSKNLAEQANRLAKRMAT
jgi:hypothetical protein